MRMFVVNALVVLFILPLQALAATHDSCSFRVDAVFDGGFDNNGLLVYMFTVRADAGGQNVGVSARDEIGCEFFSQPNFLVRGASYQLCLASVVNRGLGVYQAACLIN